MIGVLTTHHSHDGLLPSLVAPFQDAEMAWQKHKFLSALPRPPAGPYANEIQDESSVPELRSFLTLRRGTVTINGSARGSCLSVPVV
jgi:hypothetical protein